ncbi:bifunctional diguanylate cyclase/phosphodiesterase [Marinobacter nauticus]|uniref:Periplasmic sensor diguanylate cyclase/phosphodiesterase n=1 Tax=Marinobacter nauticus TaxID=2743 RepID=A0A368UZA5_MARNT|nr:EAL domain-containing protein [Marinobacter nauticus]MBW3198579.1 EAL domain-containing protein [Marinobacter nauticus]MBY6183989.1 EAL domain-containing protein [Marinobacter nauticus]RBP73348.1 periplasmic sensor diguanylate cyclase/phosphodiesterase [Marinobacter nauticus]RCW34168.1 periplasmic sensor diguanylate cyclase/phosphodiesterase [Marinobacter nauticus]
MMTKKDLPLRQLLKLRNSWIAWVVFLVSVVATVLLWQVSIRLVEDRTEARFRTQSLQLKTAIEERLLNYEQVLAGSAGLFAVTGKVTRDQWKEYVDNVDINRYYPGIEGIGYVERIGVREMADHIASVRAEGLYNYLVKPLGTGPYYYPMVYLEPGTERNRKALGYDAFSDPIHRTAMEQARDDAIPTVTGKVVLVQESVAEDQAGFLMYYPVFQGGEIPEIRAERRMMLAGYVFSAFRMNNLIDGIVGLISPFLDVRIYDSGLVARDTLMYGSNLGSLDNEFSFEMSQTIRHGGREWLLQTRSTPAFDYLAADPRPPIVLGSGLAISLLLWLFVLALIRSRLIAQVSAGRYRAITEGAANVTLVMDRRGRPLYASPSSRDILGFDPDKVEALEFEKLVHMDDWSHLQRGFEESMASPGKQMPVVRARVRDADGQWRDMEGTFTAMLSVPGVNGVVLSLRDLTQLKAAQSELHRLAFYDPLTGLANRQLFRDRLNHVVRRSRRSGEAAALMFLDLDGFKRINDTLGHDAGDELLRQVAQWLEGCVREEDSVARLGGDEFVVLLSRISGSEAAGKVAENILRRLCQRIRLNDHEVGVTVSIGITMIPHDSEDAGALMKYADLAMYRAKELGRNTYQFFTPAMNIQAARRLLQQEELATALDGDRFVLHYQPKVDLATQRVIGVEAFLRWHHPEKGLVSAQQFITLAEETGLIIRLGELALRQACIQVQALERAGFESLKMAVNFSVRQLTDSGFLDMIRRVITETGVSPERLELEMPAELLNEDPRMLRELLVSLNDLGVCLILDDFGTGSCSLVALQQLPLDVIKIDHRFIRDIPYNVSATDVASAVIALAHKLHLTVVAEGVETLQQLTFLKSAGCAQCQGNLFSYPLDEDALIGFLIRQYEKPLIS